MDNQSGAFSIDISCVVFYNYINDNINVNVRGGK